MGVFKKRRTSQGWILNKYKVCKKSYWLTVPLGVDVLAVKKKLSGLPGGSRMFITNDVYQGVEIFFLTDLGFSETLEMINEIFGQGLEFHKELDIFAEKEIKNEDKRTYVRNKRTQRKDNAVDGETSYGTLPDDYLTRGGE